MKMNLILLFVFKKKNVSTGRKIECRGADHLSWTAGPAGGYLVRAAQKRSSQWRRIGIKFDLFTWIGNYMWIWWLKKRRKVGQFRPNRRRNEWNFGRKLSSQMKATATTTTTTGSYARRQSFGSKMSRDEPMRSPFLASWRFVYLLPVQLPAQGHPSSLQATFTWPKRDLA